ncbi:MAG: carbohydrate kinase family protein [Bacteroidota bacterium]
MKPYDVLVAGEINPDLILSGNVEPEFGQVEKIVDSAVLAIGSSSAIFACGAARLGLKVAFIGVCGEDIFGKFMLTEMAGRGVDVQHVLTLPGGSTGLSVILNRNSDRAVLTYPGLIPGLEAADIPEELLREARHLHVGSYFLQTALRPGLPVLFRRARELGLTTSLDTNYDPTEKWEDVGALFPVTNILFPNEKEARSLANEQNLVRAASMLASKLEILAVKLGEAGALGLQNGRSARIPSIAVEVVDTVGAGDSFDAGFVYGYLHGWELERCLQIACACGALSTRKAGGIEAQPTLEEAMKHVS